MSQNSMLTRATEPISINTNFNTRYITPVGHHSPQIVGFGSWLDSLNDIATRGIGCAALANLTPKNIWHAGDISSPSYDRLSDFRKKPTPVIHSHCELVHPRPKTFWVLTQESVYGMEEQAASMAEARERELRAMGKLDDDEVRFERSDDDEIVHLPKRRRVSGYDWAAAFATLPKSSKSSTQFTPTGSV